MKSSFTLLGAVVLLLGTLGTGWVHGTMTNRWGHGAKLRAAEERLAPPLPERVGNWRFDHDVELLPEVKRMLQCESYVNRVYEHEQTGDLVTVALLLGPAGPIAVHTPEVCYSSRDFSIPGDRKQVTVKDADGRQHALWDLTVNSNGADGTALRVLYGWTTGDGWKATARPRFAFAGAAYLYKLQLAGPLKSDASDFDPCQDFLEQFLAQCQPRLISSHLSAR